MKAKEQQYPRNKLYREKGDETGKPGGERQTPMISLIHGI